MSLRKQFARLGAAAAIAVGVTAAAPKAEASPILDTLDGATLTSGVLTGTSGLIATMAQGATGSFALGHTVNGITAPGIASDLIAGGSSVIGLSRLRFFLPDVVDAASIDLACAGQQCPTGATLLAYDAENNVVGAQSITFGAPGAFSTFNLAANDFTKFEVVAIGPNNRTYSIVANNIAWDNGVVSAISEVGSIAPFATSIGGFAGLMAYSSRRRKDGAAPTSNPA